MVTVPDGFPDAEPTGELADLLSGAGVDEESTLPSAGDADAKGEHGEPAARKLAGRFEKVEDLEKSYAGMRKGYDDKANRVNQLEAVLNNPKLQHMAQVDPDVRKAMEEAGFQLKSMELQEQAERAQQTPEWRVEVEKAQASNDLRWELFEFQQSMGRNLTSEERDSVLEVLSQVDLPVEQAWKLTPHYEKGIMSTHQKEIAALQQQNARAGRKLPGMKSMPGEKIDFKKPVHKMSENESAAFIQDLMNRHQ